MPGANVRHLALETECAVARGQSERPAPLPRRPTPAAGNLGNLRAAVRPPAAGGGFEEARERLVVVEALRGWS
jgi:hypothetical protein